MKQILYMLAFFLFFQFIIAGSFDKGETRISLNGQWKFRTDPKCEGELQGLHTKLYNDIQWGQNRLQNPVKDNLHLSFTLINPAKTTLNIYDLQGKQIATITLGDFS